MGLGNELNYIVDMQSIVGADSKTEFQKNFNSFTPHLFSHYCKYLKKTLPNLDYNHRAIIIT